MNKNFSVPNPCHEKWDGMQPKENGRYCGSCQKVVTDFTNKTNEEILDYIKQNSGKQVCGTFKNSQLKSTNHYQHNESAIRFLAALLLVFGMTLFSCNAVDKSEKEQVIEPEYYRTLGIPSVSVDTIPQIDTISFTPPEIITVEEDFETTTGITIPEIVEPPILTTGEILIPVENSDSLEVDSEDEILVFAEKMPEFPGGSAKMMEFISNNIKFPQICSEMDIQGTVYVSFIVRKNGTIEDIKILRGVHEEYEKEAIRLIKLMPNWTPGENKGKVVNVRCNLPMKFRPK